jgi:hypothetical protein
VNLPTLALHSLGTATIRHPGAVLALSTGSTTKELTRFRHKGLCDERCSGGLRNSSFATKTVRRAG